MNLPNWTRIIFLQLTLLLVPGCMQATTTDVMTNYGPVRGLTDGVVNTFTGIPFAAPPIGEKRWLPPQELAKWQKPKPAFLPKPGCIQMSTPNGVFGQSEDCLYLNIWAPASPGPHPVMVWIHGGGFVLGSGGEMVYIGDQLARQKDVIIVTLSYRLGFLGHMSLPELSADSAYGASGNQAMLDQLAALKWVKNEIAHFGGDANNITLFGQSAGGLSVCQHLASPLSEGLFHKAIIQSGPCGSWKLKSLEVAENMGIEFANQVGCNDPDTRLDCLRSLPAPLMRQRLGISNFEIFSVAIDDWKYTPPITIDNYFVPANPYSLLDNGSRSSIPILMGVVKNEGSFFEYFKDQPSNETGYRNELNKRYGDAAAEIEYYYPLYHYKNAGTAIAELAGDEKITCASKAWAERLTQANHPVYFYHFTQDVDSLLNLIFLPMKGVNTPDMGTFHVAEIPYIFGLSNPTGYLNTSSRKQTSQHMMNYWTNFAKTGNPNGNFLPAWPRFSDDQSSYLELGNGFHVQQNFHGSICEAWSYN